uniref:Uncharacterized protein n=1 Tax=Romanomermis culicivorax TaxID=13658 RepID=A0A915HKQ1_ROMCU
MVNSDKSIMTALDLIKGIYKYQLNVTDDQGLWSSDNVTILVEESHNLPPVARASDSMVILPQQVAYLNGSASSDDAGIVSWLWTLMDESPGGLMIFEGDREKSILPIANLLEGLYKFNLTVCDKQKLCDFKIVNLNVSRGPMESESVEIIIETNFRNFIVKKQAKFVNQLETFLASNPNWDEVKVHITRLKPNFHGSSILINFYCQLIKATTTEEKSIQLLSARSIVDYMDERLNDFQLLCDYKILNFNTKYCKNRCSGRGYCDNMTKMCHCNSFWMPNFIKARNSRRTNCDWSILYFLVVVVMFCFLLLVVVAYFIYSMRKQGSTLYNSWSKNRRYKTLNGVFPTTKTRSKHKSRLNGYKDVLNSDSESLLSSEEEVIYDKFQTKKEERAIPTDDIPLNSLPT